jgi:hypothetical protein
VLVINKAATSLSGSSALPAACRYSNSSAQLPTGRHPACCIEGGAHNEDKAVMALHVAGSVPERLLMLSSLQRSRMADQQLLSCRGCHRLRRQAPRLLGDAVSRCSSLLLQCCWATNQRHNLSCTSIPTTTYVAACTATQQPINAASSLLQQKPMRAATGVHTYRMMPVVAQPKSLRVTAWQHTMSGAGASGWHLLRLCEQGMHHHTTDHARLT